MAVSADKKCMKNISDLRFGRKETKNQIDARAYSRDGYLINQGLLTEISYGRRTTKQTGCGWIACYNFLRYMGTPRDPVRVAREMERMLLWGGCIGSHPLAVWWYLHRRGYRFRPAFTRRGMERAVEASAAEAADGRFAGVIAYWHGKGAHYVTFIGDEEKDAAAGRKLRFLNAVYGAQNHRATVREFFRQQVRFPLVIVIVSGSAPGQRQGRL